jgi:hypothetical protein
MMAARIYVRACPSMRVLLVQPFMQTAVPGSAAMATATSADSAASCEGRGLSWQLPRWSPLSTRCRGRHGSFLNSPVCLLGIHWKCSFSCLRRAQPLSCPLLPQLQMEFAGPTPRSRGRKGGTGQLNAAGKPAFAAPTVSSVVLCSSAAIPTFTEIPGTAGRTVWAARGCQWIYASVGREAEDTITQGVIIKSVSDGAINVSGTHLRDIPIPRRVALVVWGDKRSSRD